MVGAPSRPAARIRKIAWLAAALRDARRLERHERESRDALEARQQRLLAELIADVRKRSAWSVWTVARTPSSWTCRATR